MSTDYFFSFGQEIHGVAGVYAELTHTRLEQRDAIADQQIDLFV